MRRLLLLVLTVVWGAAAIARVFREPYYRGQYLVPASAYSRRYLRSPDSRFSRSRVFRSSVIVSANDEPRSRAQGRFYKRAQAVPIHDPSQQPIKDSIHITAYSYDEDKHHEKKLIEDSMTMVEAHEFARGLERTTVSVKHEDITTPVPVTDSKINSPRAEFQQPPSAFVNPQPSQPAPAFKQNPGARTFTQTVQARGLTSPNIPRANVPPIQVQPQPPPFPGQFVPAIPGTPAFPLVPPLGVPPQPPLIPPPQAGIPPNFPSTPTVQPTPTQVAPQLPASATPGGAGLPPNGQPPVLGRDTRFEVINQQSANSSLEQLGCNFDWLTNTCKDVWNLGWCGKCHDFGNIFLHDCKCIQPLIPLPPRPPTAPRSTLLRYI